MGRAIRYLFIITLLPVISGAQEREPAGQIRALMESYQFSQAISLADHFLSRDSTLAELLLLKGQSLAAGYRYREAATILGQARRLDSTNIKVLNELVDVYRQSGDAGKALATSRIICALAPDNRYFRLQLANLFYSEEDFLQAVRVLLPLYMSDSSSFFVARQLGNCYNELKYSDSAIRFYRRALRIAPYDPYVTGKLANIFIREDNIAMALYWTQIFLEQDSLYIPILKQYSYCNYLLMDFKRSAKGFQSCTNMGDSSGFSLKYLGLSFYKQGKFDSAAPWFRKAFLSDTTNAEICFYYGVSACRSLEPDTGFVYLNRALRLLMPSDQFLSKLYAELADANTLTGYPDTAVILFQKALKLSPGNNLLRFKIAYQLDYHLRKPFDGLPWYKEFLKNISPDSTVVQNEPQQVSYSDYAKNRIREITGKNKR